MNQFFSFIGQHVFRYAENNVADFSTRLFAFIFSSVGSYFTTNSWAQEFIRGLLLDYSKAPTSADQQYYRVVLAAVEVLPEAMFFGFGGPLVFWLLGRRVAVLAVEGPQLRRWSRTLFSVGLALTLGGLMAQIMKAFGFDTILQSGTRLAYAAGALGCLAAVYVLTFVAAFYAFTSPNLRVIAAPWPLRHLFRGLARATMG
jgi:hypothetical protein